MSFISEDECESDDCSSSEEQIKKGKEEAEDNSTDDEEKVKKKIGRTIKNILPIFKLLKDKAASHGDSKFSVSNLINNSLKDEIVKAAAVKKRKDIYDEVMEEVERNDISLAKILDAKLDMPERCRLIELYTMYNEIHEICNTKINLRNQINDLLKEAAGNGDNNKIIPVTAAGIRRSIDRLDTSAEYKLRIKEIHQRMLMYNPGDTSYANLKEKISWCLQLPWDRNKKNEVKNSAEWLKQVKSVLDEELFGMEDIKNEFIKICNNRLRSAAVANIALCGPPGVGKSTIAAAFAKAVGLPFEKIALGGMDDSSIFKGVQESWVGATPSILLRALARAKVNNPVILFDEIDKISSEGHRGLEVQAALLHITDPGQNHSFRDNFLSEFDHDLSQIIFIFAMNDETKIDPVLRNRLDVVYVREYNKAEKIGMIKHNLWKKVLQKTVGDSFTKTVKKRRGHHIEFLTAAEAIILEDEAAVFDEILKLADRTNSTSIRSIENVLKHFLSHLSLEITMGRISIPHVICRGDITKIIEKIPSLNAAKDGFNTAASSMYL